jgi:soluble lytic murein transglycosylase-like protein
MRIGPWLVIRGLIFGNLIVILLTSALSANASTPALEAQASLPQAASIVDASVQPAAPQDAQTVAEQSSVENAPVSGDCKVSPAFPESVRQWCGVITRVAQGEGLPADLIAAVIWQESGGDPQAISRSGAVGLMQVMPRDGTASSFTCVNGPCFSSRPHSDQLRDPEFNVEYGTQMLARLFERHGNLRDALKAYGPMDRGYTYADKVLALYHQYGQ